LPAQHTLCRTLGALTEPDVLYRDGKITTLNWPGASSTLSSNRVAF
jgi:hypothetical protein